jgi:hypothetical protein
VKRAGELGGCAMDNGTKRQRDHGKWTIRQWTMGQGQWDTRTMEMGEQIKGTMGQWDF